MISYENNLAIVRISVIPASVIRNHRSGQCRSGPAVNIAARATGQFCFCSEQYLISHVEGMASMSHPMTGTTSRTTRDFVRRQATSERAMQQTLERADDTECWNNLVALCRVRIAMIGGFIRSKPTYRVSSGHVSFPVSSGEPHGRVQRSVLQHAACTGCPGAATLWVKDTGTQVMWVIPSAATEFQSSCSTTALFPTLCRVNSTRGPAWGFMIGSSSNAPSRRPDSPYAPHHKIITGEALCHLWSHQVNGECYLDECSFCVTVARLTAT